MLFESAFVGSAAQIRLVRKFQSIIWERKIKPDNISSLKYGKLIKHVFFFFLCIAGQIPDSILTI